MKLKVKRTFTSYFVFVTEKQQKKQTCSAWSFLQPPIQLCRTVYIPYFKINAPIFFCPLFFEEYLNPQIRINIMVNEHTVNYHPCCFGSTSRIHLLIFLWTPWWLITLQNISWIFFKPVYPTIVGQNFQISRVKITEKCICELKI